MGEHTMSYCVIILCALTCMDCCLLTTDGEEAFDEGVVQTHIGVKFKPLVFETSSVTLQRNLILYCQESFFFLTPLD